MLSEWELFPNTIDNQFPISSYKDANTQLKELSDKLLGVFDLSVEDIMDMNKVKEYYLD